MIHPIPCELDEVVRQLCELVKDRDEAQARVAELEKELEVLRNDE